MSSSKGCKCEREGERDFHSKPSTEARVKKESGEGGTQAASGREDKDEESLFVMCPLVHASATRPSVLYSQHLMRYSRDPVTYCPRLSYLFSPLPPPCPRPETPFSGSSMPPSTQPALAMVLVLTSIPTVKSRPLTSSASSRPR